jgi:putative aminopeptidase FrvX
MDGGGIPAGCIYILRRCGHSPVEIAHIEDVHDAHKLTSTFLRELRHRDIEDLRRMF